MFAIVTSTGDLGRFTVFWLISSLGLLALFYHRRGYMSPLAIGSASLKRSISSPRGTRGATTAGISIYEEYKYLLGRLLAVDMAAL